MRTLIIPWTAFAIIGALSGPAMTTNSSPDFFSIATRAPLVVFWISLNLLVFTIANQRPEASVLEDSLNKPKRPLPSQRIAVSQTRQFLVYLIPIAYMIAARLSTGDEALVSMLLTWMYSDLKGSDENWIIRNAMSALGLTVWSIGATKIACGAPDHTLNAFGYKWLFLVGVIVFTTVQLSDFRDQDGDAQEGRKTAPIVWGDDLMRQVTASIIVFWSYTAPAFWSLGFKGYLAPMFIGGLIAGTLLLHRDPVADENTWKLWGLWMVSLFVLPFFNNPSVLLRLVV